MSLDAMSLNEPSLDRQQAASILTPVSKEASSDNSVVVTAAVPQKRPQKKSSSG